MLSSLSQWVLMPAVTVALALYWYRAQRPTMTLEQLEDVSEDFLIDIRAFAPAPNAPVSTSPKVWKTLGFTPRQACDLVEHLAQRGQLLPAGISSLNRMLEQPPLTVAMTENSWHRLGPTAPSYVVNGPAHFGQGAQHNTGSFTYHSPIDTQQVYALADMPLIRSRAIVDLSFATELEDAARTLHAVAASGGHDRSTLRRTLGWLSELGTGAGANVLGAAITAAVTGLLASMR